MRRDDPAVARHRRWRRIRLPPARCRCPAERLRAPARLLRDGPAGAGPGGSTRSRGVHSRPGHRASRTRRGRPRPPGRRARRRRPGAERGGHGIPPRVGRGDPIPPPRGDDGRRARRSRRGIGPPPPPDATGRVGPMTAPRPGRSTGKVRAARLTDLAALGELSRLCEDDASGGRSLGLPVSGPRIGVFSLFRLPLGAFRPHDLLYVYEEDGRVAGLVRVEREGWRDEWTIVELDAVAGLAGAGAGDIRFRLVQQVLREGQKRGAARFHVACADAGGNVELFMQAGFARYGEERVLHRPAATPLPEPWSEERALATGIPAAP